MTEEARELMNKREMQARKLVEGYKPVSAGAFRQEDRTYFVKLRALPSLTFFVSRRPDMAY